MDVATMLTAFATIFVAELPDKTMLATITLTARFRRPLAVWAGASAALVTQMLIAVVAGRLIGLLPDRPVRLTVAGLFAAGAIVLWRARDAAAATATATDEGVASTPNEASRGVGWRTVVATVFAVVFIAELGDLTQLAAASLATERPPQAVFAGAATAMLAVVAVGVVAGRTLLRVVSPRVLHRVAAAVFASLAVYFALDAI